MLRLLHIRIFSICPRNEDYMQKYNELAKDQKKLVDAHVALTIGRVIGSSAEIPGFIANQTYIDELRNKFSLQLKTLEKARYDTYLKAEEAGIDTNNPQEYIDRAIALVQKVNALSPNQPAPAIYQNKKATVGDRIMQFNRVAAAH